MGSRAVGPNLNLATLGAGGFRLDSVGEGGGRRAEGGGGGESESESEKRELGRRRSTTTMLIWFVLFAHRLSLLGRRAGRPAKQGGTREAGGRATTMAHSNEWMGQRVRPKFSGHICRFSPEAEAEAVAAVAAAAAPPKAAPKATAAGAIKHNDRAQATTTSSRPTLPH